ncbi:MAG: Fic family protein [Gammaproteobacteria bacterium]|nr:Fic family protein [Gammaproteobacteria bacterium]
MPFEHLRFAHHWELSDETNYKLGQCHGLISALSLVPLPIRIKKELKQVAFVKGAQATTAIEGNTLTESEVQEILRGGHLSESKAYQEQEMRNVLQAKGKIARNTILKQQRKPITLELLQSFHAMIGENLADARFKAIPGQFAQSQRVVVGTNYRCPPPGNGPNQSEWLTKKLCQWVREGFNSPSKTQAFHTGILKAIVTHVYIEWIHPFDDGNGRTGRLVEFYLLLCAGVPVECAHLLTNHYNDTRPEYYAHIKHCQDSDDLTSFIAYAVTGFHDGLRHMWETAIADHLRAPAWREQVHFVLSALKLHKPTFERCKTLLLSMDHNESYDIVSIQRVSPEIARAYARLDISALKRDIRNLVKHELLTEDAHSKKVRTNIRPLYSQKL